MPVDLPPPPSGKITDGWVWNEWFRIIWAKLSDLLAGNILNHNDTNNIQGGTSSEYYHLTNAQHSNLTGGTPSFNTVYVQDNLVVSKTSGEGIKVDTASPTYGWKDLLGNVIPKTSGVGSPTLAAFRGGNVRAYCFAAGEDYDGAFHVPHDWAPGTDLYIHVHWLHNGTAISGSLVLNWYFTYAKGHNQAIYPAEVNYTQTITTTNVTAVPQYSHRIDEFQLSAASPSATQLDTDDIEVDGVIQFHMDATTIPTITGGSPNKPFIFYIDLHYQTTNVPTKQKAPNFYS